MSLGSTWGCEKETLEFRSVTSSLSTQSRMAHPKRPYYRGQLLANTFVSLILLTIQWTLLGTLILYKYQTNTLKSLSLVTYGDSGTQTISQRCP